MKVKSCLTCNKVVATYVNAHFKLCVGCNKKRLAPKTTKKSFTAPTKKSLEKVKLLREAKEKFTASVEYRCEGCGKTGIPLDRSHIIPISIDSTLKYSLDNLNLLCRACHNLWEHGGPEDKQKLFCYEQNLERIHLLNPNYFRRFVSRLEQEQ